MVAKDEEDPDPFAREKALYSKRLGSPFWVETADILVVTLHWLQPHLDEAEEQIQNQLRDRKAGREVPLDFMLPFLALWSGPVFLMLAGYALENLFKGYIADRLPKPADAGDSESRERPRASGSRDLPAALLSHDLPALARLTPLEFSEKERELLAQLSAASVWWGRYPIPTSHRAFEHQLEDGTRRQTQALLFKMFADQESPNSWREARALVRRVRVELFPDFPSFLEIHGIDPEKLGLPRARHDKSR